MSVPCSKLQLSVSCTHLANMDILSKSDPQVFVLLQRNNSNWIEIGRSEVIKDNLNPNFARIFEIDYFFEEIQNLKFIVVDVDQGKGEARWDTQDFLGQLQISVANLVSSQNQTVERDLLQHDNKTKSKGKIKISAEEAREINDDIMLHLAAVDLDKKDFFGSSDPYFVISRSRESGDFVSVYKSETIKNNLHPTWNPFTLKLNVLNNGDMDRTLLIQVYDWSRFTAHELIGEIRISTNELLSNQGTSHPLTNPEKRTKKGYQNSGSLKVLQGKTIPRPTFLQYVSSGLDLNLAIAIDFTASNGDPAKIDSLHHLNYQAWNPYQAAIMSVGNILKEYDSDNQFPVFGFGAKFPDGTISHCFPLNGNVYNPEINGIEEVLNCYTQTVPKIQLWGPTNFSSILNATKSVMEATMKMGLLKYFILLIITDGVITDMDATVRMIVELSSYPLSIVIVGVGNADFTNMNILDGDEVPLQYNGKRCQRDIVQFVPFSQINDPYILAKETLAEVPTQVVQYMTANNIVPQTIQRQPPPNY